MKTLLFTLPPFLSLSLFAANPTFQSFNTNQFNVNASANTIAANTNANNPASLVSQAQLSASSGVSNGITQAQAQQSYASGTNNYTGTNVNLSGGIFSSTATFTNGVTNLSLTASTDLEADANKKIGSLANGAGVKTNNGSGTVGWTTSIPSSWIVGGVGSTLLPPNALGVLTNNGSGFTNWSTTIPGTWIANATLPYAKVDTSWPVVTNYVAATNQPWTAGQAVVVVGTNPFGSPVLKSTNWPSGGGSQTPITSDIDYANFAMTNFTRLFTTNVTGQFIVYSNAAMLASNGLTTTYFRMSTNQSLHLGSNVVDTIVMKGIDGSIVASNLTANGSGSSSNFLGGITYVSSNAAPYATISPSGLNSIILNKGWTNNFNRRADIEILVAYSDAATGSPIIAFTNAVSGQTYSNSFNLGIVASPIIPWVVLDVSPNDYGSFSNYSTGSGAAVSIANAWWHLK